MKTDMENSFYNEIAEKISGCQYSIAPYLEATTQINMYENFYELEGFYFKNWENQSIGTAKGLCQHLSTITHQYLSNLLVENMKFIDYYNIYYASDVYESQFFNWPNSNHICLIVFRKGDFQKGWIIDPSVQTLTPCFLKDEKYTDIIKNQYKINSNIGSQIRKNLDVKGNTFINYGNSFDSYLPLFIYQNKSLLLAKFQRRDDKISVKYYEHKKYGNFSQLKKIDNHTNLFKQLSQSNNVFSCIDSLLTKVSIIDSPQADKHKRLVSAELEEHHMKILYYIELAVVETYKSDYSLTDRIVANVLKELIYQKENKIFTIEYLSPKHEKLHINLLNHINSFNLQTQCPKRILVNAFKQVFDSVNEFIRKGEANDAYLKFVINYFQ